MLLWWAAIRRPRAPANELQSRCSRPFAGSDTHVAAGGHGRGAACTQTPFSINITPQLTHKIAAPRDKRRLLRAAATTNTPLLVRGSRASLKVSKRSSYLPEGMGIQRLWPISKVRYAPESSRRALSSAHGHEMRKFGLPRRSWASATATAGTPAEPDGR